MRYVVLKECSGLSWTYSVVDLDNISGRLPTVDLESLKRDIEQNYQSKDLDLEPLSIPSGHGFRKLSKEEITEMEEFFSSI